MLVLFKFPKVRAIQSLLTKADLLGLNDFQEQAVLLDERKGNTGVTFSLSSFLPLIPRSLTLRVLPKDLIELNTSHRICNPHSWSFSAPGWFHTRDDSKSQEVLIFLRERGALGNRAPVSPAGDTPQLLPNYQFR